jgi:hypothetical protein
LSPDEKLEHKNSSSFDRLLLEIPSQDIVIQETAESVEVDTAKRKSLENDSSIAKRRTSFLNKLDIVETA